MIWSKTLSRITYSLLGGAILTVFSWVFTDHPIPTGEVMGLRGFPMPWFSQVFPYSGGSYIQIFWYGLVANLLFWSLFASAIINSVHLSRRELVRRIGLSLLIGALVSLSSWLVVDSYAAPIPPGVYSYYHVYRHGFPFPWFQGIQWDTLESPEGIQIHIETHILWDSLFLDIFLWFILSLIVLDIAMRMKNRSLSHAQANAPLLSGM